MASLNISNIKHFVGYADDRKFDRIIYAKNKSELSEADILYLQEAFLLFGFHYIHFINLGFARECSFNILKSLNCYSDIMLISDSYDEGFYNQISNAYYDAGLEEFLLNNWPEILIIELSEVLISKSWFNKFLFLIKDFNLINSMPIILISKH